MPNLAREFACGWIGGASGVAASHPLDTARVRIQAAPAQGPLASASLLKVLQRTVRSEGYGALYKGLISPVLAVGAWKATIFTAYSGTLECLSRRAGGPTLGQQVAAAASGAVLGAVVATPMEMVKCNAQTDRGGRPGLGQELRIARGILAAHGPRRLFRGLVPMAAAGSLSMPVWFVSNDLLLRRRARAYGGRRAAVPFHEKLLCGAVCGSLSWVPAYPLDKLKTLWQTSPEAPSLRRMAAEKAAREGWRSLCYRGLGATLARGFPQCGITMAMYELASSRLPPA